MNKTLRIITIIIALLVTKALAQDAKHMIVYPNSGEAIPLEENSIITGDSFLNARLSEQGVYSYKSLNIKPQYWPHAVQPHYIHLVGDADTLKARLMTTSYFDSII